MKTRTGFVSNSSSSSFVVALPKGEKNTEIDISITVDLDDFASGYIKTEEELTEYFLDTYGEEDPKWCDWRKKAKVAIESGYYIVCGSFANDGGPVEAMLCDGGLSSDMVSDEMIILKGDGGF